MRIVDAKISNYIGQLSKRQEISTERMLENIHTHLVAVDRDLQNLWRVVNTIAPNIGAHAAALQTNTTEGFTYIPAMIDQPTGTPTSLAGHVAIVFSTSNSALSVYNTSNNAWVTELLT